MFKNKNFKIAIEFLLAGVAFGVGRYIKWTHLWYIKSFYYTPTMFKNPQYV